MSLKPNKTQARVNIMLLAAIVLITCLGISNTLKQLHLLDKIFSGQTVSEEDALPVRNTSYLLMGLNMIFSIASGIFFIRWFHRAYSNLQKKVTKLRVSTGWAIGVWFVPIINFVFPVMIMWELSTKTYRLLQRDKLVKGKNALRWMVPTWWAMWTISWIWQLTLLLGINRNIPAGVMDFLRLSIYYGYFQISAAIMTLLMVRTYSKMEDELPNVYAEIPKENPLKDNELLDA
jgi:hypothetical protein